MSDTTKKAKTSTFFPFLDDIKTISELDDLIKKCQNKKKEIIQKDKQKAMERAETLVKELNTLLTTYNFKICGSDYYLDSYAIIEEIEEIRED